MTGSAPSRTDATERASARVQLTGLLRGAELSGEAILSLAPPNIELQVSRRLIVLRLSSLDGLEHRRDLMLLHLRWGDVLEARAGESLDAFVAAVTREALVLPELTVSLRSYGSRRAGSGEAQEAFFAPLRRALETAAGLSERGAGATSVTAERLMRDVEAQLAGLARARFPGHAPERRALEAELSDCTAAMSLRLDALAEAELALAEAQSSHQFAAWRRWSDALIDVFSAHDACWPLVRAALDAATIPAEPSRGRWWRWGSSGPGGSEEEER